MSFTRLERRKTLIERWQLVSPYFVQVNVAGVRFRHNVASPAASNIAEIWLYP